MNTKTTPQGAENGRAKMAGTAGNSLVKTKDTPFQATAKAFSDAFERATRTNGERFTRLKEGLPQWMTDAVREAHGERLPDDWTYDACRQAAEAISEHEDRDAADEAALDWAANAVDAMTADVARWLAGSHENIAAVDEEAEECFLDAKAFAKSGGIIGMIQRGQTRVLREIYSTILQAILDAEVRP